jgi:23S rRNA pseudouridine1911/1915/1917 synthase
MTEPPRPSGAGSPHSLDLPREARGERLDRVLASLLPGQSRASLQRLMRDGRVRILGRPARPSYTVRGGERIEIELPPPRPSHLEPQAYPLAILHEDADLLVLDKPAGLPVHPGAGARRVTLVNALLHHCKDLSVIGGVERPGIVHRLDRDTSGVLVVAKNDAAHRSLAAQFKARTVKKLYEALVWGVPRQTGGAIDRPIGRHPFARVRMTVREDGRPARTVFRVNTSFGEVSLLDLEPATGRTHQIRVHLSFIGHPIVGDSLYGGRRPPQDAPRVVAEALAGYAGLALHARRLGFAHPRTGEWREFTAARPESLQAVLDRLIRASRGGPAAPFGSS